MRGLLIAAALALVGCTAKVTVEVPVTTSRPIVVTPAQDAQAGWAKSYAFTTCGDFVNSMDTAQREAFARFVLDRMRETTVTGASSGAEYAFQFVIDLYSMCGSENFGPNDDVIAAATMVYLDEAHTYQPTYP